MIDNLLEIHPKTASLVCEWFQKQFLKSLEDQGLPDDFIEGAKSFTIDNEKVNALIGKQPRGLFDFFDENEVHILTDLFEGKWFWIIDSREHDSIKSEGFLNRKESELAGVTKAFDILEKRLNVRISEADTSGGGE